MKEMKLIHRGSTKDVYQLAENYLFLFSDRYSVFDWGEMPDQLQDKGPALARFTKEVYRLLQQQGIRTHYLELPCDEREMVIRPYEVIRQKMNMPEKENIFIPLEVIFRLGVAKGSSLLKKNAGFHELQRFSEPMIEFTTKLERIDRPLSHDEARILAGLNSAEWQALLNTTHKIARELERIFATHDIELWDGKVEFALGEFRGNEREIILVDTIGPDELRLTKDGVLLSKEVIRQYYRKTPWYQALEEAKARHGDDFKDHLEAPEKLPLKFRQAVEQMYLVLPDLLTSVPGAKKRLEQLLPLLREPLL